MEKKIPEVYLDDKLANHYKLAKKNPQNRQSGKKITKEKECRYPFLNNKFTL